MKILGILLLIVALKRSKAQGITELITRSNSSSAFRTDDYMKLNKLQYAKTLQDNDSEMDKFRHLYAERLDDITIILDMILNNVVQNEKNLNPLEMLSDFSKSCVIKYRSSLLTAAYVKTSILSCVTVGSNQINTILASPLYTKTALQNYYINSFEKEIATCANKFANTTKNYTTCVTTVTSNTNTYTISNQKTFSTDMDLAHCTANANIKKALDCSYTIQSRTLSTIAEVNISINKCLLGQDESYCKPCAQTNTCSDVYYLNNTDVNYTNRTMLNPFYGRANSTDCLILKIQ